MYGIIILAAGNSSRLGEPKQLLPFKGSTLIRNIAEAGMAVSPQATVVVTGSVSGEIENSLEGLSCRILHNDHWQKGMASSIVTGLSGLMSLYMQFEGVIIAVSDQPMVSAGLFNAMIRQANEVEKGIVACSYDETLGTPVLFSAKYLDRLLELTGDHGAKKLLEIYSGDLTTIPFPDGGFDIDTQEDYRKLLAMRQ